MVKTNENSKGVNEENCNGVDWSYGVNRSKGVNGSNGVNWSKGVNGSDGVNGSNGVNWSKGVNRSNGVNWSKGVNRSNGVDGSYGILNSYGVDNALFLADKARTWSIFGTDVTEERFEKVMSEFKSKLKGWFPKFNNAFELYVQNGNDWKKVKASDICSKLEDWQEPYEAWKDMPKEAIAYIRSLPEFNTKMFERITGIKTDDKKQELLSKAQELIDKANELKEQAEAM